jgi:adenylate kinase family enzyme
MGGHLNTRTIILGSPKAGKTTLAKELLLTAAPGTFLWHLDTLIASHAWSEQSEVACAYLDSPVPWIVEGCAAGRALRKWLARHPTGKPCDTILRLTEPRIELSKGQETLRKGERTIWLEIAPELTARGVEIA